MAADLILRMSLQNELSPEIKKAIQDFRELSGNANSLRDALNKFKDNKQGILKGSIDSDVAEIAKLQSKVRALKAEYADTTSVTDRRSINLEKERVYADLVSAYNREFTRLASTERDAVNEVKNATAQIKAQQAALAKTQIVANSVAKANKAIIDSNKEAGNAITVLRNDMVRLVRQTESLLVGLYFLKRGYDSTLGVGHDFNKLIESETIGLKLLISQNLEHVDVLGRTLTAQERYNYAQQEAAKAMEIVRKINVQTPHSFKETLQIFKLLTPQVLKLGGSLEDVGNITQRMSVIAASMGIEFQQFLKTVDSALSGEMQESALKRALEQFGVTNAAIKELKKNNGDVTKFVLDGLEQAKSAGMDIFGSWEGIIGQFKNEWDSLFSEMQKPMFDAWKIGIKDATVLLHDNRAEIVWAGKAIGETAKQALILFTAYKTGRLIMDGYNKVLSMSVAQTYAYNKAVLEAELAGRAFSATHGVMSIRLRATATALKAFIGANLPMIAIAAAFELWNMHMRETEDRLNKVQKATDATKDSLALLGEQTLKNMQSAVSEQLRQTEESIRKIEQTLKGGFSLTKAGTSGYLGLSLDELADIVGWKTAILGTDAEINASLKEQLETQQKQKKEYQDTLDKVNQVSPELQLFAKTSQWIRDEIVKVNEEYSKQVAIISNSKDVDSEAVTIAKEKKSHLETQLQNLKEALTESEKLRVEAGGTAVAYGDVAQQVGEVSKELQKAAGYAYTLKSSMIGLDLVKGQISQVQAIRNIHTAKLEEINATKTGAELEAALAQEQLRYTTESKELHKKMHDDRMQAEQEYKQELVSNLKAKGDVNAALREEINLIKSKHLPANLEALKIDNLRLQFEKARAKESGKSSSQALRDQRVAERVAKEELEAKKETYKQELLRAKLAAGTNGLSQVEERELNIKYLKDEIEQQKKVVAEAKAAVKANADGSKIRAAAEKEVTHLLELQLDLMKMQETTVDKIIKSWKDALPQLSSAFATGGAEGFADAMKSQIESSLDLMKNSGDPMMATIAYGVDILRGLFNSQPTQAEIDAGRGRVEFSDDSIKNLGNMFENVQYPMLEATNKMYKHIRNMDSNFQSVAKAIAGKAASSGIDLTGANFVDTYESTLFGLFSSSTQLIGTGLDFSTQYLTNMMDMYTILVRGYTTTLETDSALFGLFTDTDVVTRYKTLPDSVKSDIADAFASGYEAILTAGVELGFSDTAIADALARAKIEIGKIDFTGLSPQEVSDRFSQAVSEAFSGVINGIDMFSGLIYRYADASEYALETLIRIATEYDQASFMFDMIGKNFVDGALIDSIKYVTNTYTETSSVFTSIFGDMITLIPQVYTTIDSLNVLFGRTVTYTETIQQATQTIYTSQMQILDIVESTGGMDNFTDAMNAFMSNFYTESEQFTFLQRAMQMSFETLGIQMPKTNDEFRRLLETMDTSTEQGAYLYGQVLLLSEGFAEMSRASENLASNVEDAVKRLSDAWLGEYSPLTMLQKEAYSAALVNFDYGAIENFDKVDLAYNALQASFESARTQEDTLKAFYTYANALENQITDATNWDIIEKLSEILGAIQANNDYQYITGGQL